MKTDEQLKEEINRLINHKGVVPSLEPILELVKEYYISKEEHIEKFHNYIQELKQKSKELEETQEYRNRLIKLVDKTKTELKEAKKEFVGIIAKEVISNKNFKSEVIRKIDEYELDLCKCKATEVDLRGKFVNKVFNHTSKCKFQILKQSLIKKP